MPRLIDADALVQMPWVLPNRMTRETALECFKNIVSEAPTIEVESVRHGYWGMVKLNHDWMCSCSVCGEIPECFEPSYCPNCGAKMDVMEDG